MIRTSIKTTALGSLPALALVAAASASAAEFQAGNTAVDLYGYAKLDIIFDLDADLGNSVDQSAIALDDAEDTRDGHFRMSAIESRLGVATTTPTGNGDLKTVIEGDFYGGGGGTLRLRQAYGEWNGLLAGQTWSNFTSFLGNTGTIDFSGLPGQSVIARQAQLRYTAGLLSVAIEAPATLGGGVSLASAAGFENDSELPDLTIRFQQAGDALSVSASGVVRQLGIDDGASDDTEIGFGANVSARLLITPGLSVQGSVTYGDGIGGYMYQNTPPAYVANGSVETITALGGTLGITADVGIGKASLAYGIVTTDLDDAVADGALAATANEEISSLYANYIWSPVTNVSYGIEAGYHTRTQQNGADGDAIRVQGMVRYSF